jgi:hypothetical protein
MHALRENPELPIELHLVDQQGKFESSSNTNVARIQPLSDWKLSIVPNDGALNITISAELRATKPIPDWNERAGNFWPTLNDPAARIVITFSIDPATRVAVYGLEDPGS